MSRLRARSGGTTGSARARPNPWLWDPTADPEAPAGLAEGPTLPAAPGPTAPHPGVPIPDAADRLPHRRMPVQARLWWVGAHGGAGETTLAALLPCSRAAGHAWPVVESSTAGHGAGPVVLVARTSMVGLRSVQRAAAGWASGSAAGADLLGLVLVADAPGRLPRALKDFADTVAGGVPRVWHLPWIESWRLGEDPATHPAPRHVRRLVEDVTALLPPAPDAPPGTTRESGTSCTTP